MKMELFRATWFAWGRCWTFARGDVPQPKSVHAGGAAAADLLHQGLLPQHTDAGEGDQPGEDKRRVQEVGEEGADLDQAEALNT